jgi:Hsp70 protein
MCIGTKKQVPIDGSTIDVEIPAGISPGRKFRIRDKDKSERDSSEWRDLYLEIVAKNDSVFHLQGKQQGKELEDPSDIVLKVGEGTSSVLSILLGNDRLLIGIIRDGYTSIFPNKEDTSKISDLLNGDIFIDELTVALHFQQLIQDVNSYFNIEFRDVIVAVPCWFGIAQHKILKRLATFANLQLLHCYPSPILASIGCKLHSSITQKIIVLEISQSSLSTTILDISNGVFEVLGTNGKKIDPGRVKYLCRISLMKLLDDAQITKNQIDEIILLGDSPNATIAQKVILDVFDQKPVLNPRSGKEVILGTLIWAGSLSGIVKNILVLDPIYLSFENHKFLADRNFDFNNKLNSDIYERTMALAGYDKEVIERLLNTARLNNANQSEQWYWEKILYDMERDCGVY